MDVYAKLVGVRRIQLYVDRGRIRAALHRSSRPVAAWRGAEREADRANRPGRRELQIPLGRASRREILISLGRQQLKAPASPGAFYCERLIARPESAPRHSAIAFEVP